MNPIDQVLEVKYKLVKFVKTQLKYRIAKSETLDALQALFAVKVNIIPILQE